MKSLNYDASLPVSVQAPFVVNAPIETTQGVVASKAPGDQRYKDYIPNKDTSSLTKASPVVVRKDQMRKPLVKYSDDYISGDDMKVKTKDDTNNIMRLAKQMYAEQKKRRHDYEVAKALVDKATRSEREHPSVELARAIKIVARNKPLTKEEAIEQATIQFYGHDS